MKIRGAISLCYQNGADIKNLILREEYLGKVSHKEPWLGMGGVGSSTFRSKLGAEIILIVVTLENANVRGEGLSPPPPL